MKSPEETSEEAGPNDTAPRGEPGSLLHPHPFVRKCFVVGGCLALAVGAIGVVLPLLPTTPFLLVAAAAFSRGSASFHRWLLNAPAFGSVIAQWESTRTVPRGAKRLAITLIVLTVGSSAFLFVDKIPVRAVVLAIGAILVVYVARLPTAERPADRR